MRLRQEAKCIKKQPGMRADCTVGALDAPSCYAFRLQTAGLHAHAKNRDRVAGLLVHTQHQHHDHAEGKTHAADAAHAHGGRHAAAAAGTAEGSRPQSAGNKCRREQPAAPCALAGRCGRARCQRGCRTCTGSPGRAAAAIHAAAPGRAAARSARSARWPGAVEHS
eukprot:5375149-Pleurochrysis_carterae.AAC.2